nr:immunoglobulin light chain junction region [Macaca mulatta]MOV77865.1 immunoglobulin light chain junction region [Macaca mulatta]MOV78138.1 immunoglobulin light chain junction region [Macaca mulatta]MOV78139.1 immunoglobulin light chain junction region [Macaca mulatta]MOV78170.1 immunoglobulin light chain junction region [Macaca mulatta]
CGQGTHLPWTF